jgi:DNA-binding protein YbaB
MSYPTKLELCQTVGNGLVESEIYGHIKTTVGAITLKIDISDCDYPDDLVKDAVKEACRRAVEHYSL